MEAEQDEVPFYEKPGWADVVPIPQDDGPNPLVPIAYTKEYSTTMDYFRAICRSEEQSERALELTKIVIELSPSHYTAWHCRQKLLKALNKDLAKELEWIQWMSSENPKSYQTWHHRQVVVEHIAASFFFSSSSATTGTTASSLTTTPTIPYQELSESQQKAARDAVQVELDCIADALAQDSKNYHAWSYRQWVLSHFGAGPWWEEELQYIEELLTADIRNNSAWNQRFFVISQGPSGFTEEIVQREVEYAKTKIDKTPGNESPWVYLVGVLNKAKHPLSEIKGFCEGLLAIPRANFSPHLHSTLLDIYEEEAREQKTVESVNKAKEEAIMLAEKVDVIRSNYWSWRKNQLKGIAVDA
ncbi:protein prenyltransferase alpha subunit [Dissophora ornata]|nr:CAAX geranylgeranyltransferase alpha subunit [Dissophora ornata]KAI8599284.1 protein prenyltransferase alpha subunit [Dissophora ornata]